MKKFLSLSLRITVLGIVLGGFLSFKQDGYWAHLFFSELKRDIEEESTFRAYQPFMSNFLLEEKPLIRGRPYFIKIALFTLPLEELCRYEDSVKQNLIREKWKNQRENFALQIRIWPDIGANKELWLVKKNQIKLVVASHLFFQQLGPAFNELLKAVDKEINAFLYQERLSLKDVIFEYSLRQVCGSPSCLTIEVFLHSVYIKNWQHGKDYAEAQIKLQKIVSESDENNSPSDFNICLSLNGSKTIEEAAGEISDRIHILLHENRYKK